VSDRYNDLPELARQTIEGRIANGWQDDEIIDELDRLWNAMGHLAGGPGGGGAYGPLPIRVRRLVESEIGDQRAAVEGPRDRPRGNRWTDTLFASRWREACERSGSPYTYVHVAPEFEWLDGDRRLDADPDYLGRLWRRHGKPQPSP
jgi:hypothetical protein